MQKSGYFEGWYFKHQNEKDTVSFIPGISIDKRGESHSFIQILTDIKSYYLKFPFEAAKIEKKPFIIRIAGNEFSSKGIKVDIKSNDICIAGQIRYSQLTPLKSDIMGPFAFVPFMQCRHEVVSVSHELDGRLSINGNEISFDNGRGYIEGDSGSSFPRDYLWTQCNSFAGVKCSVMASVAHIPFFGFDFTGCICSVMFHNNEYHIATYNGGKIIKAEPCGLIIQNKRHRLVAEVYKASSHKLMAPDFGRMNRVIRESPSLKALYRLYEEDKIIFELESDNASFEFVQ